MAKNEPIGELFQWSTNHASTLSRERIDTIVTFIQAVRQKAIGLLGDILTSTAIDAWIVGSVDQVLAECTQPVEDKDVVSVTPFPDLSQKPPGSPAWSGTTEVAPSHLNIEEDAEVADLLSPATDIGQSPPFQVKDYHQKQSELASIRKNAQVFGVDEKFIYELLENTVSKAAKDAPKTAADTAEIPPTRKSPFDITKPPKIRIQKLPVKESKAEGKNPTGGDSRSSRREEPSAHSHSRESSRDSREYQSRKSADTRPHRRRDDDEQSWRPFRRGEDRPKFRGNQRGHFSRSTYQQDEWRDRNNNSPYKPRDDREKKRSRSGSHGRGEDKRRDRRPTPPAVSAADAARDAKIDQMSRSIEALTAMFAAQAQPPKKR